VPKVDELVVVLITVVVSVAIATDVYVTEDHTVVTIAHRDTVLIPSDDNANVGSVDVVNV